MQSLTLSIGPATATRSEQLAEAIRRDIVRNVLPAGSRVTEESLAERYGVSRTPVREALRVLTREALLHYIPRTGYVVPSVDLDEMDDLYAVRVGIEEQAVTRIAASGPHPELDALLAYWGAEPAAAGDVNLVFADEAFHETLAAVSGSSVLPPLLRNINQRLHMLRVRDFADATRVRRTFEQHAAIVVSLLARDARGAQALVRAHIWQSYAFVRHSALAAREMSE